MAVFLFVALAWLRGTIEVHDEMEEMRTEYESVKLVPKVTLKELFVNSALRIPLIIAIMVMFAQQLSGINAVMFFSTKIFTMAQLDKNAAQNATMAVGAMNVIMTFVSLILVEKAGRKTLLLAGFSGMFIDTALLAICLAFAVSIPSIPYINLTSHVPDNELEKKNITILQYYAIFVFSRIHLVQQLIPRLY